MTPVVSSRSCAVIHIPSRACLAPRSGRGLRCCVRTTATALGWSVGGALFYVRSRRELSGRL